MLSNLDRKGHPETTWRTRTRRDHRIAAMHARDLAHQREPEAGALGVVAEPVERREHALAFGFRNAAPVIHNIDDGRAFRPAARDTLTGGAPWRFAFSRRLRTMRRSNRDIAVDRDAVAIERTVFVARAFLRRDRKQIDRLPSRARRPWLRAGSPAGFRRSENRVPRCRAATAPCPCRRGFPDTVQARAGCATAACAIRATHSPAAADAHRPVPRCARPRG